jgi:hypothetical protein
LKLRTEWVTAEINYEWISQKSLMASSNKGAEMYEEYSMIETPEE